MEGGTEEEEEFFLDREELSERESTVGVDDRITQNK